ncbi:Kelch-type beta propeller domain containing protein [Pseudohyphozyma bogoriensis]|nr:Kelch-type beta propeller domain containing protein [Pseudohyphozyma bogoriensis]
MRLPLVVALLTTLYTSVYAQQNQPNPCFRWSGQVALANAPNGTGNSTSTLWYYGGEAATQQGQTTGLWTNALVALDLSKDWPTGTPAISLVQADNGNYSSPPAVALGALWASADGTKLYQYGGEFSDSPSVSPPVNEIYAYTIASGTWDVVETTGDTILRAAEGSTAVAPLIGTNGENMAYYFSGHEDDHTVNGWSNQVPRLYLSSLVQFDLGSLATKNFSSYSATGSVSNDSSPEINPTYRADGTLTYVPGYGTGGHGILVAIGGATDTAYVDNSVLDVFDIGAGGWTKQATLGNTIGSRVNHCAVRGTAKVHGVENSHIIVYGGQKLNQSDRDSAMYILSLPSYTWTFVGDDLPSQPTGRAGHQCAISGDQLIVMGGYLGSDIACDQPGIYVYNVSSSSWTNQFVTGTQFSTPAIVANITGGIGSGTSESGSGSATGGDGSQDPDTSGSTTSSSTGTSGDGTSNSGGGSKTNIGAIVGGVVGGIALLALLGLLVFFLLRKKKKEKEEAASTASNGGLTGFPYEKTLAGSGSPPSSGYRESHDQPYYASDDVEDETRNMEAAFGSHLVPKRTLRVTNPEVMGDD